MVDIVVLMSAETHVAHTCEIKEKVREEDRMESFKKYCEVCRKNSAEAVGAHQTKTYMKNSSYLQRLD